MKSINLFSIIILVLILPVAVSAQVDTTRAKTDTTVVRIDSVKVAADTTAVKHDTAAIASVPMNCYKQWIDYFTESGAKPVTDGTQLIVIAFKSKESCHCYMGKVEIAGGKIKAPLMVQNEGGDYNTFTALGKKLDPDFLAAQGDALWDVTNGMSVLFQTTDQEYGRVFFYKSLNKNKKMNKEAPSPSDLLK